MMNIGRRRINAKPSAGISLLFSKSTKGTARFNVSNLNNERVKIVKPIFTFIVIHRRRFQIDMKSYIWNIIWRLRPYFDIPLSHKEAFFLNKAPTLPGIEPVTAICKAHCHCATAVNNPGYLCLEPNHEIFIISSNNNPVARRLRVRARQPTVRLTFTCPKT